MIVFLDTGNASEYNEMMSRLRSHHPTRNHPLFPILEYTAQAVHRQDQILNPFMDGSFSEWLAWAESAPRLPPYLTAGAEQ